MNFFFFNDTATTEIYTLSLHDALPICARLREPLGVPTRRAARLRGRGGRDRGPGAQRRGGRAAGDSRRAPLRLRAPAGGPAAAARRRARGDRKSTRLNSSHLVISYAVFCLKKKKKAHI